MTLPSAVPVLLCRDKAEIHLRPEGEPGLGHVGVLLDDADADHAQATVPWADVEWPADRPYGVRDFPVPSPGEHVPGFGQPLVGDPG